jgi:hypothetical protein
LLVAVVVALAAMLLVGAGVARAHSWRTGPASLGCGGTDNSADSTAHGYWYNSELSSAMAEATSWARANAVDPTDINTFDVAALAPDTDVVVYDQDYTDWCGEDWHPAGQVIGLTHCASIATNPVNACEKSGVRYDESYTNGASTTRRRNMACHESGHTLGLDVSFTNSGCMYLAAGDKTTFSSGDRTWINSHY